ncbi:MAG: hypothetical protein JXR68_06850 [Bacteroidales bacterium]|nr:hypothetical protein [Bacteroidales bacterium]
MKHKLILITIICFFQFSAFSQQKFTIGIETGKPMSSFRYFKNYNGKYKYGVNVSYHFYNNFSLQLKANKNIVSQNNYIANINSAYVYLKLSETPKKLFMSTGVAYGFQQIIIKEEDINIITLNSKYVISADLTLNYQISKQFFTNLSYDFQFAKMKKNPDFSNLNFTHYTLFHNISMGFSYNF